jgi:hypothetical protein
MQTDRRFYGQVVMRCDACEWSHVHINTQLALGAGAAHARRPEHLARVNADD